MGEAPAVWVKPAWKLWAALGLQSVLFLLALRARLWALLYPIAFALPLVPVLVITKTASQYVYASAAAYAVLLAYLLLLPRGLLTKAVAVVVLVVGFVHTAIQASIYHEVAQPEDVAPAVSCAPSPIGRTSSICRASGAG